uniref:DUF4185 domain-containing protein n=1 Tax=Zooxanthella nutricula TaxID=1333877 RepID=A0A7S2NXI6_9DINO
MSRSSLFGRGSRYSEIRKSLAAAPGARSAGFGDAPLQTLYAALAVPEEQVHVFTDVGMVSRGGASHRPARGLPPPAPKSPYAQGGVLEARGGSGGWNGTNGTNGTGSEYPRQKAAIYVLADGGRLGRLVEMLQSLDRHFNNRFHYPVVVFEENLLPVQKARLSAATRSPLTFVPAGFGLPAFIDERQVPNQTGCLPERGMGYRHMCRFQAGIVNRRLAELGYEWHWRMDDDSLLTGEVPYDVFGYMASAGKLYGYVSTVRDDDACIVDLWDTAKEYAQRLRLSSENFFGEWPRGAVYYNNFEVSHSSVFTSPQYRAYFDHIDQNGGIYMRRWGDAPIKSIAVSMFVSADRIHRFGDLGYRHAPFIDQEPAATRRNTGGAPRLLPRLALAWKPDAPVHSVIGSFHIEAQPDAALQQLLAPSDTAGGGAWIGADSAASVGLGPARGAASQTFVWLFGDTLVGSVSAAPGSPPQRVRRDAARGGFLVRNSVGALEVDARTRRPVGPMRFAWKPQVRIGEGDGPVFSASAGPREPDDFMWPLAGLSYCPHGTACKLVVIASQCAKMSGAVAGLLDGDAFTVRGSVAIVVHNPHDAADSWTYEMQPIPSPAYEGLVMWHAGIARADEHGRHDEEGEWAYFLGALGGWTKQILGRLPIADLARLDFGRMQAWSHASPGAAPGWSLVSALPRGDDFARSLVTVGGVSESSQEAGVWFHRAMGLWYIPFVEGTRLILRTARTLTGPWSSHAVYELPERWSPERDYFAYAVKSHPELAAEDEIVLTYNVNLRNNPDMGRLFDLGEADTYVPQFLRLQVRG